MDAIRTFTGSSEAELWQQVAADMEQTEWFEYEAVLQQGPYQVHLDIDIDPGGGFEGAVEYMSLTALVPTPTAFRFALHEQDWVHEVGKLLGLADIELGDPALDKAFIITTNEPATLHDLLADPSLRQTLLRYPEMRLMLETDSHAASGAVLKFSQDSAITDPAQVQEIYHLLLVLLQKMAPQPAAAPPQGLPA